MAKPRNASKLHKRLAILFCAIIAAAAVCVVVAVADPVGVTTSLSSWHDEVEHAWRLIKYCLPRSSNFMMIYSSRMNINAHSIAAKRGNYNMIKYTIKWFTSIWLKCWNCIVNKRNVLNHIIHIKWAFEKFLLLQRHVSLLFHNNLHQFPFTGNRCVWNEHPVWFTVIL